MRFISLSLLVILVTVSTSLHAQDSGGEGQGTDPEVMPRNQKEFIEKAGKLTTLTNRIAEADRQFIELVRKKAAAKTSEEKQRYIRAMVELNTQRNKDVDAHNKLKSDLAYRYPNQGETINRRYHTQSKKSLEELEGVLGLDELLTATKKVIEKKFAPFKEEEDEKKPPQVAQPVEEKPKRLRLEK